MGVETSKKAWCHLAEHGLAELAIIEVVAELLGPPAEVLLEFPLSVLTTSPLLGD